MAVFIVPYYNNNSTRRGGRSRQTGLEITTAVIINKHSCSISSDITTNANNERVSLVCARTEQTQYCSELFVYSCTYRKSSVTIKPVHCWEAQLYYTLWKYRKKWGFPSVRLVFLAFFSTKVTRFNFQPCRHKQSIIIRSLIMKRI